MIEDKLIELTWKNLSVEVKGTNKKLLKNVSGQIKPYTLNALMGPSGAGKSTLFNVLTGSVNDNFEISGKIFANGWERESDTWNKLIAHVGQDFKYYGTNTVSETLEFICNVRGFSAEKTKNICVHLFKLLGLYHSKDTYIKNLSGGEKTRLSIGIELIGDPLLLFLDEPFSGLDSFSALTILDLLKEFARAGKTIVVVIHQPSYHFLQYFDNIYLLSQGMNIFEGSCNDCIDFFLQNGYPLPEKTNPSDFFLESISLDSRTDEAEKKSFNVINNFNKMWLAERKEHEFHLTEKASFVKIGHSAWKSYYILKRAFNNRARDFAYIRGYILKRSICLFVVTMIYRNFGRAPEISIISFLNLASFLVLNTYTGVFYASLSSVQMDKDIILRERKAGLYSGISYFSGKCIGELLFYGMFEFPFLLLAFIVSGYGGKLSISGMLVFLLTFVLAFFFSANIGVLISSLSGTLHAALVNAGCTNTILFTFCKSSTAFGSLNSFVKKLVYYNPVQLVYSAIYNSQKGDRGFFFPNDTNQEFKMLSKAEESAMFATEGPGIKMALFLILIYGLITLVIGSCVVHYKTKPKLKLNS